ncbi:hypothetical protein ASU66_24145 [Enterobacter hormaechei subsp. xiangfangensis]|nr:hypothetical protein ASU66_24145 [Enterobacter hormaechei subsp. xiangfangensis]
MAGLALCQRWAGLGHGLADFLGTAAPAGQLLRGDKVALAEVITEALDQPGHLAAVLVQRRAPVAAKLPLGQFEAGQPIAGRALLPLGLLGWPACCTSAGPAVAVLPLDSRSSTHG